MRPASKHLSLNFAKTLVSMVGCGIRSTLWAHTIGRQTDLVWMVQLAAMESEGVSEDTLALLLPTHPVTLRQVT